MAKTPLLLAILVSGFSLAGLSACAVHASGDDSSSPALQDVGHESSGLSVSAQLTALNATVKQLSQRVAKLEAANAARGTPSVVALGVQTLPADGDGEWRRYSSGSFTLTAPSLVILTVQGQYGARAASGLDDSGSDVTSAGELAAFLAVTTATDTALPHFFGQTRVEVGQFSLSTAGLILGQQATPSMPPKPGNVYVDSVVPFGATHTVDLPAGEYRLAFDYVVSGTAVKSVVLRDCSATIIPH